MMTVTLWCGALLSAALLVCPWDAKAAAAQLQTEPAPSGQEPVAEAVPAPAAPPASPNVSAPPAAKVAPPAPDKGQIVFFRPFEILGLALSFDVREGETDLGHLGVGRYLVITAEPGIHTYSMRSEAKTTITLDVEAGETYYVKQTMTVGFLVHRPNLAPSDEAAFVAVEDKLKEAQP